MQAFLYSPVFLHQSILDHAAVKVRLGTRTQGLRGPRMEVVVGIRGLEVCAGSGLEMQAREFTLT